MYFNAIVLKSDEVNETQYEWAHLVLLGVESLNI